MSTDIAAETLFASAFAAVFLLNTGIRLWLAQRQLARLSATRDRIPAPFVDAVTAEEQRAASDYGTDRIRLARVAIVIDAAFLLVLTYGGLLDRLSAVAERISGDAIVRGVLLIGMTLLVAALIDLPVSAYRQFVVEARHGFNRMTSALFIADTAKGAMLTIVLGTPLAAAALWLMNSTGSAWWLWVWALWTGFNLLLLWLFPTLIAPLFNRFRPLDDRALSERIQALLDRCGFAAKALYVMDGSRRTSHGNAYFTGFGRHRRIVFFDTLLDRLEPEQIEAVLAHELGHFKHRHVAKRIAFGVLGVGLALAVLAWLNQTDWFFASLGVTSGSNAAALILFTLIAPLFVFPLNPLINGLSRRHEYEADRYAANQTSPTTLAEALVRLYRDNAATLDPDPLHSLFHDSHPAAVARISALRNSA